MRYIVLDTETTGLSPEQGHQIIEIGCILINNRRVMPDEQWHQYLDPERDIDPGAVAVHGLTRDFLRGKPRFASIAEELFNYLRGATLIIHNAPFDMGFLNSAFRKTLGIKSLNEYCEVIDTLAMARQRHPGQKNNLDALCQRYAVNNKHRDLHGALLDSRLLASVYLAMTRGQETLFSDEANDLSATATSRRQTQNITNTAGASRQYNLPVVPLTAEEDVAHQRFLVELKKNNPDLNWS